MSSTHLIRNNEKVFFHRSKFVIEFHTFTITKKLVYRLLYNVIQCINITTINQLYIDSCNDFKCSENTQYTRHKRIHLL